MKYAIISDIHGNLEALTAVFEEIGDLPILCLGDIVGYGPNPNECVDLVRSRAKAVVVGNHDLACSDGTGISTFNPHAALAASWTHDQITDENRAWLRALPTIRERDNLLLVHGSPYWPEDFNYVSGTHDAYRAFDACPHDTILVGHTHVPSLLVTTDTYEGVADLDVFPDQPTLWPHSSRAIINPGAVGQPRDGNPLASFAIYDEDARTVRWRRIAYDVATTQTKIRTTDLHAQIAKSLADRLAVGS